VIVEHCIGSGARLQQDEDRRRKNQRTAWILAAVALAFFIGFFIRRYLQ
jgi:hypothetical protein